MPDAPGELEPEGGASYTPGTPGGLVPEGGGAASPGDPGNLTPNTPASPSAPPSISPETPGLPADPQNYIQKMQLVSASGASRTFLLGDNGNYVRRTHTGAMTDTIPTNATSAFPILSVITIRNATAAQTLTVSPAVGVTLNGTLAIPPNGNGQIIKVGLNEWDAI
jgi:hypothetical protein